ncbi:MAG: ATP-binding protein [Gammaproteobacteria bacterium]|nr:ATP-binding protein [Gammaproteobacteria bacterium]
MARIRVRARAVDMLGRQQIAGIPTAIHELFKNAHDAYAAHVEVDYFRADGTFVLRDDGYGMTRDEFENNWLTLGTESKVGANRKKLPSYLGKNTIRRAILGEKGIGRLAIATVGCQVLILSRAKRNGRLQDLVVSFIHWGLFEVPGVDLDSVVIPIETLLGGTLPDQTVVSRLTKKVADNVQALEKFIPAKHANTILKNLDAFSIDPELVDKILEGPSLRNQGQGTHFYVMPTDPILERDIDEIGSEDVAAPLQKMLLGFSNTMMPDRPAPVIETAFRDHRMDGRKIDLIGNHEFFTPEEFENADHHFEGKIDEFGQSSGTLRIYGAEPETFTFEWPYNNGKKTTCGPFSVKFAYVQGLKNESRLPPEEFARVSEKLNKIGGLYIYRDGIRILPYGNSDYDFLNIERRRTKSAQDWFFSFRRMFGAIELSSEFNGNLMEKAGREGFITNAAYRQLRDIMEDLFKQLAKTFFRKEADRSGEYNRIKEELQHRASLLQKREKRIKARKVFFESSLKTFFERVQSSKPDELAEEIISKITQRLDAIEKLNDTEKATHELLKLESFAKEKIEELRSQFMVKKPRGFSTSKKVKANWHAYQDEMEKMEKILFHPLSTWIDKAITKVAGKETIALDRRRRARKAINDTKSESIRITRSTGHEALKEAKELVETVRKDSSSRISQVSETISSALVEFAKIDTTNLTENQIKKTQEKLQQQILRTVDRETDHLEAVINHIHSMVEAIKAGDSLSDEEAALEAEYLGAKEQLGLFTELAQVGTALGIIQHEFSATIRSVRENIQRLGEWADLDEELADVYSDIRASFEHLDGYLGLFTPLNKRLQRHKIPIVGEEVRRYLQHIFGDRLQRHKIKMSATREFDRKLIEAYPSTYYPTFVNLIDNAIYWIVSRRSGERSILLDANEYSFTVTNTGPGIPLENRDWIFGFANSEKDGGRGMGLYISKTTLTKDGADIVLENAGKQNNPTFRIILPEPDEEEKE